MFDFTSPIRQAANIHNRNIKGLVTFDRKTRKDSFYYYKAMWSKEPFVHIGGKRYINHFGEEITVKVYSNQPEVLLITDEGTFKANTINGKAVFENVPLKFGTNEIVARAGECVDNAVFNRQDHADESYVYVDQNPGLNVRNWFLDEQSEAELFPEGYLSIRSTMNDLLACDEAMEVISKRMPDVAEGMKDGVGTFSLEKCFQYTKPDYTEEEIKALNAELTKIAIK
jgi:beta-galactosidase